VDLAVTNTAVRLFQGPPSVDSGVFTFCTFAKSGSYAPPGCPAEEGRPVPEKHVRSGPSAITPPTHYWTLKKFPTRLFDPEPREKKVLTHHFSPPQPTRDHSPPPPSGPRPQSCVGPSPLFFSHSKPTFFPPLSTNFK